MERRVIDCDKCGKSPAKQFSLPVGRRQDGAGSTENVDLGFDLCSECTASLLQRWLEDNLSYKEELTRKFLLDSNIKFREF